ncbi:MAG: aspartate aminotransferase family protein [Alphaproteobacteria bacterium]|nr:aspartate aminotransferase family protein [Alphaproteobacteria bacterium]
MTRHSNRIFAERGLDRAALDAEMVQLRAKDRQWNELKNLRAAYDGGDDVTAVANAAFLAQIGDNMIYSSSAYPSLRQHEQGVIAMVGEMLNAPEGAVGSITTGGTESILMAVKAARDWARATKPRATQPEMIVPRTAHAAFNKAGELLGVKVVRMIESPGYRADIEGMTHAINGNTIMLVGSAPPYPYALVDPLTELSGLALEHELWLHVDACVGGFVLPFVRELGHEVPGFDFLLPGVASMSADLHKYGYSGRGASVLMIRSEVLAKYQGFHFDAWPAGVYYTASVAGSRNGGAVASSYAVMRYLGRSGYRERVAAMLESKRRIGEGLVRIGDLGILGRPEGTHFSIVASDVDMYALGDGLNDRGWLFLRGKEPRAIQLQLNARHGAIVDEFLADVREVAGLVQANKIEGRGGGPVYIA